MFANPTPRRQTFLTGILICLSGALVPDAAADGFFRDGVGARSVGRGGTNLGFADSGSMVLENPAAILNMNANRMTDVGFDLLMTDLQYGDADNPLTSAVDNPIPVGQFSIAARTPNPDIGYGLGVFSHAGFGANYVLNGPAPFTGKQRYESFGALLRVLPAVSVRLSPRLTVGGNFGVAVNHMELEGPYTLQGPSPFVGTPARFDLQATGASFSWLAALQYQLTDRTTIGINYQDQTRFTLDGNTRVEIPGLGQSRFDTELAVKWPRTFGMGLKHNWDAQTDLGLDLIWHGWSDAFTSFNNTLTNPDNPVFAAVVGNRLQENLPLKWRDTLSVRTGFERRLGSGRTVRAGYVYHRNPVPDQTISPYIQATLEHAFSLGYGWQIGQCEIDTAWQFSFSGRQETGASAFVGGDFDNATSLVSVHWLSVSIVRRF